MQSENKSDQIEKNQLQNILSKYFQNVPNMSEMDRDEILKKELATLQKYGTYTIKVSEIFNGKFKGDIEKLKLADQINSNNYGNSTNYSVTVGNVELSNWKIFYKSNNGNVFLILGDYLPGESLNVIKNDLKALINGKSIYWDMNALTELQQTNQNTLFEFTKYTLNSNYQSSLCASTLLNTDNWSPLVNTQQGGTYAIGGPTAEMWCNSLNAVTANENKINYRTNENGYEFCEGFYDEEDEEYCWDENYYSAAGVSNYDNELYFKNETGLQGYYIASPSVRNGGWEAEHDFLCWVYIGSRAIGSVTDDFNPRNDGNIGIRPVVALSPNTYGTYTNNTWILEIN